MIISSFKIRRLGFVLFSLLLGVQGFAQNPISYNKLWNEYREAREKRLPQEVQKCLETIRLKAEKEREGAQYLQAVVLEAQSGLLSYQEEQDLMHSRLLALERCPWLPDTDRTFASFLRLLFLQGVGYEILDRDQGKVFSHRETPESLALWSTEDLQYETMACLDSLEAGLGNLQGQKTLRYPLLRNKGADSELIGYDLAYSVLYTLAEAFKMPYSVFYTVTYSLHPSYYVFNPEELRLPRIVLKKHLDTLKEKEHLLSHFLSLLLRAEAEASNPSSELLFRLLRADLYDFPPKESLLDFYDGLLDSYRTDIKGKAAYFALLYKKAELLWDLGRESDALEVCLQSEKTAPKGRFRKAFRQFAKKIKEPEAYVDFQSETLRSNTPLGGKITYKNLTELRFSIYDISEDYKNLQAINPYYLLYDFKYNISKHGIKTKGLKDPQKIRVERIVLPFANDYKEHQYTFELSSLPLGAYVVIPEVKGVSFEPFLLLMSDLQLLSFGSEDEKGLLILQKKRGNIADEVRVTWFNDLRFSYKKPIAEEIVRDGVIKFPPHGNRELTLFMEELPTGDSFIRGQYFYLPTTRKPYPEEQNMAVIFTDRSIYRPGQILFFKGIGYQKLENSGKRDYRLSQNRDFEVRLYDSSRGEETLIGHFTSDSMGAFHGSFSIPEDVFLGTYSLRIIDSSLNRSIGQSKIRIEAYKRPTFTVQLPPEDENRRLYGDTITPQAEVKYLAGLPMSGTILRYRLSAEVIPNSWPWQSVVFDLTQGESQSNDHGNVLFPKMTLQLRPDQEKRLWNQWKTPPQDLFIRYRLSVEATNSSGETEMSTTFYYSGKRNPHLTTTLVGAICIEELKDWRITAEDFIEKNIPGLHGSYEIYREEEHSLYTQPLKKGIFISGEVLSSDLLKNLSSGKYQIRLNVDELGFKSSATQHFYLFSYQDKKPACDSVLFAYMPCDTFSSESPLKLLVGSSESTQDIYIQVKTFPKSPVSLENIVTKNGVLKGGKALASGLFQLTLHEEQQILEFLLPSNIEECFLSVAALRDGVFYREDFNARRIDSIPQKNLIVEGLRETYTPGEKVSFKIALRDSLGNNYPGDLALWMYDAALDELYPYKIPLLRPLYEYNGAPISLNILLTESPRTFSFDPTRTFLQPFVLNFDGFTLTPYSPLVNYGNVLMSKTSAPQYSIASVARDESPKEENEASSEPKENSEMLLEDENTHQEEGNLNVQPVFRKDFRETAVWLPKIKLSPKDFSEVSFNLPDGITEYTLCLFGHDRDVYGYSLKKSLITAQKLSLMPNFPRYIRQGDRCTITTDVVNHTDQALRGIVKFTVQMRDSDKVLYCKSIPVDVKANASQAIAFEPEPLASLGIVICRMSADFGDFYDAWEQEISVLPLQQPILESIPFIVRAGSPTQVDLSALFDDNNLHVTDKKLIISLNANPLWGALEELPEALQPSEKDAVNLAVSLYAMELGELILKKNPEFRQWLELIEKEPELISKHQAQKENEQILRGELGVFYRIVLEKEGNVRSLIFLLHNNEVQQCKDNLITALKKLQNNDGGIAWYPGMRSNRFITHSVLDVLRLLPECYTRKKLADLCSQAISYYRLSCKSLFEQMPKGDRKHFPRLYGYDLLHLLSNFEPEQLKSHEEPIRMSLLALTSDIPHLSPLQLSEMMPIIMQETSKKTSDFALKRLKEFIRSEKNLGMRLINDISGGETSLNLELQAHVETIGILENLRKHTEILSEMKLYLLNTKRTLAWRDPLTRVKALACLLGGEELLKDYDGETVLLLDNGEKVSTRSVLDSLIAPPLIRREVTFPDSHPTPSTALGIKYGSGVAWGEVFASFSAPISTIRAQGPSSLHISRKIFVAMSNSMGEERLIPIEESPRALHKGDKITIQLTLTADQPFNFLVLKDRKPACVEPVSKISGYRDAKNFGYYLEQRDSEVRFYIDYLPKGQSTLSYDLYIDREGTYFGGLAEVQAMFSPEFVAHSDGRIQLEVNSGKK